MKRLLVIRNPAAGRRRGRRYGRALSLLNAAGCRIECVDTGGPGDAAQIARNTEENAFDAVVVAGGDGTINEVVNGLAGRTLPLGIIPLGTANVLAHEIGMGTDVGRAVETILSGRPQSVAAADAGGRLCCLMVSAGYDARAIAKVSPRLKRQFGEGAYYAAGMGEVLAGSRLRLSVEVDGRNFEASAAVVMNGRLYGGRFVCAPDADIRQPLLYAVLLTRTGRINSFRYGVALVTSRLHRLADVLVLPATHVRILAPEGEPCQSDGDLIGRTPMDIAVRENAVRILYPPD